jgi:hypothetical protein
MALLMFVRKKRVTREVKHSDRRWVSRDYYQLVENYRQKGVKTPRQRVLMHLGTHPTVDAALEAWPKEIRRLRSLATRAGDDSAREAANALREKLDKLRRLRNEGKA